MFKTSEKTENVRGVTYDEHLELGRLATESTGVTYNEGKIVTISKRIFQTDNCTKCLKEYNLQVEQNTGICGTTSFDNSKCWKKCWQCQKLPICFSCMKPCKDCQGNYCQDCFASHLYVEKKLTATCAVCFETKTLYDNPDVNFCGHDWKTSKDWGNCINNHLICYECDACC